MKPRLVLIVAAATAALFVAGCGGSSSSSSTDPASIAPPKTPLFVEVAVQPEGKLKSDVESLAESIAGIDDLGGLIVSELEKSASDSGESFDFAKEVEPWLGEKAGISFESYDGDDFTGVGIAVQTTDADATQEFIDKQAKSDGEPAEDGSYEGVDYKVESDDGQTVGIVDDLLVLAEDEATFKHLVDASGGDSLADEASFASATAATPSGSFADVFVDIGGLIDQSGGTVDPDAEQFLDSAGIDPDNATAVASVVPGAGQVAIEFSSDLAGQEAPTGDASSLLGELPGDAFAAVAVSGFGKQLKEAIDSLDEQGVPDAVPPNQLKKGLKELGIDLEGLTESIQDAGAFALGSSESTLSGALVLTMNGEQATNTISSVVRLLRSVRVSGVTVLKGKYTGFSIRSDELGDKPLVVASKEGRIAIGYGLPATLKGLLSEAGKGKTLSEDPSYSDAVASLGDTPISGFADGPAALSLADSLIPSGDEGFEEAKKYLKSIRFLALGSATQGDLATAKLILGVGK